MDTPTFGFVCKCLSSDDVLLLVLDNLNPLCVKSLLQLGKIDICGCALAYWIHMDPNLRTLPCR
jgi:hypothetical protein